MRRGRRVRLRLRLRGVMLGGRGQRAPGGHRREVCCVVGLPLWLRSAYAKASEAWAAVDSGADELDVVMNFGYLRSGMAEEIKGELSAVVAAGAGRHGQGHHRDVLPDGRGEGAGSPAREGFRRSVR